MKDMIEQSPTVLIASIYPMRVGIDRPRYIPRNQFWIEAVEKGEAPKTTVIGNQDEPREEPLTGQKTRGTIFAHEIANDFIVHTVENSPGMTPTCHPGVWISRGVEYLKAEERENRVFQNSWFGFQMERGNQLAIDNATKAITPLMRLSAVYLGRTPAWLNPPSDEDFAACPYCGKQTAKSAAVCANCHQVTNITRWVELEKQKKEALKELVGSAA